MVTFSYIAVFILLGSLVVIIDIILFHHTFGEVIKNLFFFQLIQDRIILFTACFIGLLWAIIVDIRNKRKKGNNK